MIIKIFPVHKNVEFYSSKYTGNVYAVEDMINYINWKENDVIANNKNLINQHILNLVNIDLLAYYCKLSNGIVQIIDNNTLKDKTYKEENVSDYLITYVKDTDLCSKFSQLHRSFNDLITRDMLVMRQAQMRSFNVTTYVVVLLDNNFDYYGHIYVWISNRGSKTICY